MVVDALLLCFSEDCDINDGSAGREYYMNASLMVSCNHLYSMLRLVDYWCWY